MSLTRSIARGLAAGVAGTAAMTAYQLAVAKLRGQPLQPQVPHRWADAPPPAQVVKKAADAVGKGGRITRERVPLLTNVVHWVYGIGWGAIYGAAAGAAKPGPVKGGLAFGSGVWAAAYGEMVPLGVYEPPWKYPPEELALDLSYHLVYGLAVSGAYAALDR